MKFLFWLLATIFLVTVSLTEAQQPKKIPQIGYVSGVGDPNTPGPQVDAFRQGLRELGYIEGKNILVDYRYAEGKQERYQNFVAELVQLKVDVLIVTNPAAIRAAMQATKAIPIIMVTTEDPVVTGIVQSLARPGGNITGLSRLTRELSGKRLELFKEVLPGISRVGILSDAATPIEMKPLKYYELRSLEVFGPNPDFEGAFQAAPNGRGSAIIAARSALLIRYRKRIADLAIKNRLPSMTEGIDYVEAGGLMSYSADDAENHRRAAYYVDRILKGTKPADIPIEQPTKFDFVINLKTAKQLGLTISPNVLARADKIIR
jgi:putative ABC transport system substrate-binding protein